MALPDAEQQHAGGVGVEGAGVADLAGAEQAPALGHDVVAGPAGRLVDHHQAVGPGVGPPRPIRASGSQVGSGVGRSDSTGGTGGSSLQAPQDLLDALGVAQHAVGLEAQLGGALERGLAADGALEALAQVGEGLGDLLVGVVAAGVVVVRRRPGRGRRRPPPR